MLKTKKKYSYINATSEVMDCALDIRQYKYF